MRVAYFSVEGSTYSWARRLHDEGAEVLAYCPSADDARIGDGLIPKTGSKETWVKWGARDPNTIWFFDCTDYGDLADRLRARGYRVIGGGSFCDRLENDRSFGMAFARKHGITLPPYREFGSVADSLAYMRARRDATGFAWKADRFQGSSETCVGSREKVLNFVEHSISELHGDRMTCLVQDKIDGEALSTARWWNGKAWTGPYEGTIEFKGLMNGNVGPATGCALNTVWFYTEEQPKVARLLQWESLAQSFRAKNAPPGLYDINAIVNEQGAFFLEWTPRLGWDSEAVSQRGITSLVTLLERLVNGQGIDDLFHVDTAYHGVRLTIPPYPNEGKSWLDPHKSPAIGQAIVGVDSLWHKHFVFSGIKAGQKNLECADPFGFIGTGVAVGRNVPKAYAEIEEFAKGLYIDKLQYRTDGGKYVSESLAKIEAMGYETSPFLSHKEKRRAA